MTASLKGALHLVENFGLHVFPLSKNSKIPIRNLKWREVSTNDHAQVRAWALAHPGCNFAVDCEKSGITVIDIDRKKDSNGFDSIRKLIEEHGSLPPTLSVDTPSNGRHVFYKGLTKTSQSLMGKGIDTRSKGGYVVAPGSRIGEKSYRILKSHLEIAKAPKWIGSLLQAEKREKNPVGEGEIVEGERNGRLTSLAGSARSQGCGDQEILALLLTANEERVRPPLPRHEIETIVKSVLRYPVEHAKTLSDLEAEVMEKDIPFLFSGADVTPSSRLRIPWVAEGRYAKGYLTVCVAKGGVGKTLFMFSDLLGISAGRDLLGYGAKIEKTNTWLHSTEDSRMDLERRLLAARQAHGISAEDASGFYLSSGRDMGFNLAFMEKGKVVKNLVDIEVIKKTIRRNSIGLFAIDPFSGAHGLDENSNAHMVFVKNILNEIAEETGCAVIAVHHARKSSSDGVEASRGASALTDGARTVLMFSEFTKEDGERFGVDHPEKYTRVSFVKSNNASMEKCKTIFFEKKSLEIPEIGETAAAVPFVPETHSLVAGEKEKSEDAAKVIGLRNDLTIDDLKGAIDDSLSGVKETMAWNQAVKLIRDATGFDQEGISLKAIELRIRRMIDKGGGVLDTGHVCLKQSRERNKSLVIFPSKGVEPLWDG